MLVCESLREPSCYPHIFMTSESVLHWLTFLYDSLFFPVRFSITFWGESYTLHNLNTGLHASLKLSELTKGDFHPLFGCIVHFLISVYLFHCCLYMS